MRRCVAAAAIAAIAGCGGGSHRTVSVSDFTGAPPWNVSLTLSGVCDDGSSASVTQPVQFELSSTGPSELAYPSGSSCPFEFSLRGDLATLSNGPLMCSSTSGGQTELYSFTSYTLTASDAHHLTLNFKATGTAGTSMCTLTGSGTGTR
jgi:hypothetical protein